MKEEELQKIIAEVLKGKSFEWLKNVYTFVKHLPDNKEGE